MVSAVAAAQCDTITDEMTGKVSIVCPTVMISQDSAYGIAATLVKTKHGVMLTMKANEKGYSGCIDMGAPALILFDNGKRLKLKNRMDFNCRSTFHSYFKGMHGQRGKLRKLQEGKIKAIQINTRSGPVKRSLTEEQSKALRTYLNLM